MHSKSRSFFILGLAGILAACGGEDRRVEESQSEQSTSQSQPPAQSPLIGSESVVGLEALHDTVQERALRGDTLGLLRVLVRDSIYREHVWPASPAYEEREEVWNFVIGLHKANSVKGMRRLLSDIQIPDNGPVKFPEFGPSDVPGGVLYYAPKGERKRGGVRLFGSALCLEGVCQVLSYSQGGVKGGNPENEQEN